MATPELAHDMPHVASFNAYFSESCLKMRIQIQLSGITLNKAEFIFNLIECELSFRKNKFLFKCSQTEQAAVLLTSVDQLDKMEMMSYNYNEFKIHVNKKLFE